MKKIMVFVLMAWMCPLTVFALDQSISCDPPQGMRVDYFVENKINLDNQKFIVGRDQISGMKPRIILHENGKDVSLTLGDTTEAKTEPKPSHMQVIMERPDQISFTGMVSGAPVMATYYPKMNVLIYSQQSVWPGDDYQGARAVIFYSKCQVDQVAPLMN